MRIQSSCITIFRIVLFVCLSANASLLQAQDGALLRKEVDKLVYLDAQIKFERTPVFLMGVIWQDSTFFLGYSSEENDSIPIPGPESLFEIGEVSQLFLAELALQLLDPEMSIGDPLSLDSDLTVDQLLSHHSGIPRFLPHFGDKEKSTNDPFANLTYEDVTDWLDNSAFDEKPGYLFSSLNYVLLARLLEANQELSYDSLLRQRLLDPLNLSDTGFDFADSLLVPGLDKGQQPAAPWSISDMSPAQGLKSSAGDLCQFIRYLMENNRFESLEAIQKPTGIRKNTRISYGWHVLRQKRYYPIFLHSGATSGYRCYVAVVPETETAVVVLSNSVYGLGGIGFLTLRMLNNYWKK
ncbi:MAG: beta-lactamase family protein [Bacteroidetes bacterium]|nr:beta-lactamase family protein [Bacteroidota bacterium]